MASSITLSAATRQNLLSLQDTANLLSTTQSRLSTGKKVNSALDNPTNFFTSQSLTARSSDLSNLLDGISNGVQTIQAANQGITSIQKLVDSAKSTANQALADKSATSSGQAATAATVFGSKSFQGLAGTLDGTQDFSSLSKDGSIDISLDGGKTSTTIRLDSSTLKTSATDLTKVTAAQVSSAINSQIANSTALKGKVSASVGSDGRISFSTTSAGATQQLKVSGAASSTIDIGFGKATNTTAASATAGTALAATVTLGRTNSASASFTVNDGSKSVDIKLDQDTVYDTAGSTLGATATRANILSAINKQLSDAGSSVTASLDSGNKLVFTSQDLGPSASVSVIDKGGDATIGLFTTTAALGTFAAGTISTGATRTAGTALGATNDFTAGSAKFTIGDGTTSATITLDSTTAYDAGGTTLGATASRANVVDAINLQLAAKNVNITASLDGSNNLVFTNGTPGTGGVVDLSGIRGSINLGYGTSTATGGTQTSGTGTAASGLSATGSDATDGSAKAVITGSKALTTVDLNTAGNNASFSIQLGNGQAKTITLNSTTVAPVNAAATTGAELVAAINKQFDADTGLSGQIKASLDVNNKLVISSTAGGSSQKITITPAQGSTVANNVDIGFGSQTSTINAVATNTATPITATGKDSTGSTNTTRESLAKQFNELLNQITQQAKDSSYNGVNLLYRTTDDASENTLRVTFNENGSSNIDIKGVKFDSDGLGLTSVTGGFQSDDEIKATLTAITSATNKLRSQSSTFGSNLSVVQNRQDFSKNLINILDTGSANL
ncbi:MAG: hypothetical protein K2X71_07850, partial [Methylobacterium sp.]|uniref:flagellin N-terminal helical domain-containing protein n=1 Tax=Methylobacterium sp. TaxID=409 RepID=UPI00258F7157